MKTKGNKTNQTQLHKEDAKAPTQGTREYLQIFGGRLKQVMNTRAIKCSELAELAYIAPSTVTGYRTGRRGPDMGELMLLAIILNVSVDYLLGLKDEPEKLF